MESNLKNVLIISFGFLLLFIAYGGLQSLQSSLHSEEGLGVASLSVIYAALILSSMFLPPILIKRLGCKWTIAGSMCCYIAYSLGNFYASWYTLIPTSMILGLGGAPLWSAKCTYLTIAGNSYGQKAGKIGRDVINQYFGIFFLIFHSSGALGNLISSLIFGQTNTKVEVSKEDLMCCGAYDCMTNATANISVSSGPTKTLIYTLLGIYTGSGVLAVLLIVIFLDQIKDSQKESETEKMQAQSFWSTFLATFRHLKDKRQCFLIPLTMYSGFEQAFLAGDYTKSYVTCALGIHYVGYVMISFSVTNSLCSLLFGKISQFTGRKALFALASITNLACIIPLLLWKPHPNQLAVFFIFPALWGFADAIWQTQTNALYGVLFEKHKEAAFANYRLWESLGFVIAFGYSTFLHVYIKLYIVLAVLVVAMVMYGVVEYQEAKDLPRTRTTVKVEITGSAAQQTSL
uniref:Protein unc-93 homolog A n=1 Tax=Pelodiscus sinensis TaxID=13735 RepID=K7F590_PELSI|nr:protein unc-93 homolog A isoform X1 [Pelodiscus sinensis]XP_006122983.1 protein unc-93 homolog A isoform X1 [Pelodiscus sinensis]XP_025040355.1 protein unc-93 homolog A isoform X1 [Pelodiscus sinensis]|eukprot:XP_006122982.1 protein unc-93 homolog A isoform X1 [Pelodiscus sinensis]